MSEMIKVWDPLVRTMHWLLVASFFVAYFTEDDLMTIHTYAGYTVLGIVGIRILWGFVGPHYARFSDFVYRLATIKGFLRDTLKMKARRYIGHNPAGGLMIVILLLCLTATSFSGVLVLQLEQHHGFLYKFAKAIPWFIQKRIGEIHEAFANLTLLLVFIHIAGVIFESIVHKENLARAMVTGQKRK